MRRSGLVVWAALRQVQAVARPGLSTVQLDQTVREVFDHFGAQGVFEGYPGRTPFPAVSCISVNEELVHGIPSSRVLQDGDLITVDAGCRYQGWCADAAVSFIVGTPRPATQRLLQTAQQTLRLAIQAMSRAQRWSQVARQMLQFVRQQGYWLVDQFVGHGIGRHLHEKPDVPNVPPKPGNPRGEFLLQPGLVIAVEPMLNTSTKEIRLREDHWTVVAADGLPCVHVEHTVAVTDQGVWVLTGPPSTEEERRWLRQQGFSHLLGS